ncbi:MAG: threonine synthase [Candidatus Acetothermia bacterium]
MSDKLLKCSRCGRKYPLGQYSCERGDGILEVIRDYSQFSSLEDMKTTEEPGIWKYSPVLPSPETKITFYEGGTPLVPSSFLGEDLGLDLFLKDEGRNPTGAFKDRAAAVMLSMELEMGHEQCTTASSGNAAGALALYSALSEIDCFVFMFKPSREKLYHTLSYGATVFTVDTEKEEVVHHLTDEAAEEFDWNMLTTTAAANPFVIEGYKTIAYEIYEQGGVPDSVFAPVGSGTMLLGIWKGFRELSAAGLIDDLPRLVAVQPQGCNPIVRAYERGEEEVQPIDRADTIATALALEDPGINGDEVLRSIRETNGAAIAVEENQVKNLLPTLTREEGVFAELSGAVGLSGVLKARQRGMLDEDEKVVAVISGSGFKDMDTVADQAGKPVEIPPEIEEVQHWIDSNR